MRSTRLAACAAFAVAAAAAAGCGKAAPSSSTSAARTTASAAESVALSPDTPAPSGRAGTVTWAVYREVQTVDPIQAFDYPDNTAVSALCDALLRQLPDGGIEPGLATATTPDPRTLVLDLDPAARFWDGTAVTPADVVFSLERNREPRLGGFYGLVFERVTSIRQTGEQQVTLKLRAPDMWLQGELSQMPGVVVKQAYAEARGARFGSPSGGTMCSGAFRLGDWKPGAQLSAVANGDYWNPDLAAHAEQIDFKGVPDDASLTSGLLTGAIGGTYMPPLSALDQLRSNHAVTVTRGPSFTTDALVVASLRGALGDVRVRQALSLAIDRRAFIDTLYKGMATLPRTLANPGTWGYGRAVFETDWNAQPEPAVDVARARALVEQAGAAGKTITLGMTSEVNNIATMATAVRSAGEAIGLRVVFKAVPAASYINFFIDPKAREGVDAFLTTNYPDYADPAAFYTTFTTPGGSQNYSGWEDRQVTALMERARATEDDDARARLVAQVGDILNEQLPWIPLANGNTLLVTDRRYTGAPASFVYMGGPWAYALGTK